MFFNIWSRFESKPNINSHFMLGHSSGTLTLVPSHTFCKNDWLMALLKLTKIGPCFRKRRKMTIIEDILSARLMLSFGAFTKWISIQHDWHSNFLKKYVSLLQKNKKKLNGIQLKKWCEFQLIRHTSNIYTFF